MCHAPIDLDLKLTPPHHTPKIPIHTMQQMFFKFVAKEKSQVIQSPPTSESPLPEDTQSPHPISLLLARCSPENVPVYFSQKRKEPENVLVYFLKKREKRISPQR